MTQEAKEKKFEDTDIISINASRDDLKKLQHEYPNMEIIVGKLMPEDI